MAEKKEAPAELTPDQKAKAAATKERLKIIQNLVDDTNKRFGDGAMMVLGDTKSVGGDAIPTSSLTLDMAIGVGGIPRGRIIEIYGPESSGKSTLCLSIVAEAQKRGGVCAYIDAENALDTEYARAIGVNTDELLMNQPDYGEQGLDIAATLCESNAVSCIVIDSLAALIPKAELDAESFEKQTMGLQARMMSQSLRKLSSVAAKSGTTIIFINQMREKIGIMFGNPETTSGGKALKFYASVRLDIRRIDSIKRGNDVIGNKVRVKVVKNKMAPPFREALFQIIFGHGIDREAGILEAAVTLDLIEKAGSWYSYGGNRIGQGDEKAKQWLKDNVSVADQLEAKVKDSYAALKEAVAKKPAATAAVAEAPAVTDKKKEELP